MSKKENRKLRRQQRKAESRAAWARKAKEEPGAFWTYVILRTIVILILIRSIWIGQYDNAIICVYVLVLYVLLQLVENRMNIEIPSILEIIIFVFVFLAEILGELESFFLKVSFWDTMLHTTSGFLLAAVGFSLVNLLNRNEKVKFQLSPAYLAIVAFCFSMTMGVLWEFFEFAADRWLLLDMQKDTILSQISTVDLDPTLSNTPVVISGIQDVILQLENGETYALGLGGYLDIGIYDTMADLFVNFIGAVVFSVVAYFETKSEKRPLTTALALRKRKANKEETGNAKIKHPVHCTGRFLSIQRYFPAETRERLQRHTAAGCGQQHVRGRGVVSAAKARKALPVVGKEHAVAALFEHAVHTEARGVPGVQALLGGEGGHYVLAALKGVGHQRAAYRGGEAVAAVLRVRGHGVDVAAAAAERRRAAQAKAHGRKLAAQLRHAAAAGRPHRAEELVRKIRPVAEHQLPESCEGGEVAAHGGAKLIPAHGWSPGLCTCAAGTPDGTRALRCAGSRAPCRPRG